MIKHLSLKDKFIFITVSILWTCGCIFWIYEGYEWDIKQQAIGEQYYGPEAYYP